jgi:hypothetical protein
MVSDFKMLLQERNLLHLNVVTYCVVHPVVWSGLSVEMIYEISWCSEQVWGI